MFMSPAYQSAPQVNNSMVFQTKTECWIVPSQCELVKLLIEKQSITADKLCFTSSDHCHCFVRRLFLLALQDEYQTAAPSSLADLARKIIHSSAQTRQTSSPQQ